MTRRILAFDPPTRFVAGTVGLPGERAFFLQARRGSELVTVALEKEQVAVLSERIDELLNEVANTRARDGEVPANAPADLADAEPLDTPIIEEFRVGAMALGWDEGRRRVVVEAHAIADEGAEIPDLADDEADGPDTLRVWLDPAQARAFAHRARQVVAAGRPPCPFCSEPLDPEGHICPRSNGYRRRA